MRAIVFLLALLGTTAQGCVFANGFDSKGCPVIIGYGGYELYGAQVTSNGPDADFLSDPDYLVDGKPGTLVNVQWSSGAQTTASWVGIHVFVSSQDGVTAPVGVVGLLNTSLPEGLVAQCLVNGVVKATSTLQQTTQAGRTSVWFVFDATEAQYDPVQVKLFNNVNGSAVITSSAEFTVGELYAGNRADYGMKRDGKWSYVGTNRVRLSSAGIQWPVLNPCIRTLTLNLSPLAQKPTFSDSDSVAAVLRSIFASDVCAVVPFVDYDPAYYVQPAGFTPSLQPALVSQTAFLGQLTAAPTTSGDGDTLYNVTMTFQESV